MSVGERASEVILGLHVGHDASVCFVSKGRILWAGQEERFSRNKAHTGFPFKALEAGLHDVGLAAADIRLIAMPGSKSPAESLGGRYTRMRDRLGLANSSRDQVVEALMGCAENLAWTRQMRHQTASHLLDRVLREVGFRQFRTLRFDHHLAHAASSYFCSGWPRALVVTIDGKGD